ncbi:hypothetical protein L1049_012402 [Liquidambar formosana]|uniref:SAC3/GANP/THP3 conserved domain-containing protein n=1 Tax=Liquidambar formosana TaxID=63359 RepID=A0AAP0N510_LIQFO
MAFPGFGKQSGPANPPKSLPPFGHFTRPPSPSPPFPDAAPQRSPRPIDSSLRWGDMQKSFLKDHDAQTHQRPSAPYVALNSSGSGIPAMIPQFQDLKRTRSPPLPSADRDNSRTSGPDVIGRPIDSSSRWGGVQKPFLQDHDAQNHQRPSAVAPYVALSNSGTGIPAKIPQFQDLKRTRSPQNHQRPSAVAPYVALSNSGTSIPTKISQFQDLKRTRSPPLPSADKDNFRNSSQNFNGSRSDMLFDNRSNLVPQKAWAPPLAFENNHSFEDLHPPFGEAQRPTLSSPALDNGRRLPVNYADLLTEPELSPVSPYVDSYDSGRTSPIELADVRYPKRTRSPPIPSSNEVLLDNSHLAQNNFRRPSISPPRMGTRSNVHTSDPQTQTLVPSAHNIDAKAAVTKPTSFPVPKRSRSPPVSSSNQVFQGNSYSTQDDTEREMQAKAKRLARFKVELSQTEPSSSETANQRFSGNRQDQAMMEKHKYVGEQSVEAAGDFPDGSVLPDSDGLESSSIIIGLCPDMCPESERAERERKGDLDQYERLDGDRNQSSKSLAVTKYNRTAEREADLIRPMPILQKMIDYLLDLLDQPYDDKFLGMYNFLWDIMREIQMDLRMQHIFNLGSITLLEQMLRPLFHLLSFQLHNILMLSVSSLRMG